MTLAAGPTDEQRKNKPAYCGLTGLPFFGFVSQGEVWRAVYGGPYTSYTRAKLDSSKTEFVREVFDEDEACWTGDIEGLGTVLEVSAEIMELAIKYIPEDQPRLKGAMQYIIALSKGEEE